MRRFLWVHTTYNFMIDKNISLNICFLEPSEECCRDSKPSSKKPWSTSHPCSSYRGSTLLYQKSSDLDYDPAETGYVSPCKQCKSRSAGFWRRSQLMWICTVCDSVSEFVSITWIKQSKWLIVRSGYVILIYSAWPWLKCQLQRPWCRSLPANKVTSIQLILRTTFLDSRTWLMERMTVWILRQGARTFDI